MPNATFLGHPAHPMLVVAPAALLPFAFAMDLLFRRTRRSAYRDAAYLALMGGVAGGAAAAATGAMDYRELPAGSREKQVATVHAALNVGLLGASAANLVLRTRGEDAGGRLPFALGAIGALGVFVSSWFGGHLVFELGVRVKGHDQHALERQRRDAAMADQDVAPWQGPAYVAVQGEPAEGPFQ